MGNEKETAVAEPDRTTDFDVMKAMSVGCSQNHQPSIEAARRVLTGLSQAPPETLAEVLEVLLEGGCFTDEDIDLDVPVDMTLAGLVEAAGVVEETELVVPYTNSGHGHAWMRPDGIKARCGGPAMCSECRDEQRLMRETAVR